MVCSNSGLFDNNSARAFLTRMPSDVGTVFIAIATKSKVYSEKYTLGNHRTKVINKAVNKAFEMLRKEIFKN